MASFVLLALFGCSSSAEESDGDAPIEGSPSPADLTDTCGAGWVEECERAGCDPADALWQGCRINGWAGYAAPPSCAVDTGFPGDDRAPCPPDPADGFQLHFGPADYADPAEMEKHLVPTDNGDVDIQCVYLALPNTEERFLGHMVGRVRAGVHHTQLRFVDDQEPTSSSNSEFCLPFGGEFLHMGQSEEFQVPDLGVPNPEPGDAARGGLDFEGSVLRLSPGRVLALELHYINATTSPLLREGWINFYYQKPEEIGAVLHGIQLIGAGISVPPQSTGVVRRACEAPTGRTVTHLQGHSHVGTTRFSIWVRKASTNELIHVYEDYDPTEPGLLTYSSAVVNREPDRGAGLGGGASGALHLDPGDALVWECEIENTGDTMIRDGGPNANGDQMCYVFGNFVADGPEGEALWGCGATEAAPY